VVDVLVIDMSIAVMAPIGRPELQLVTGGRTLNRAASMAGRVLSPADFIATR
jgi:hypothetical protein